MGGLGSNNAIYGQRSYPGQKTHSPQISGVTKLWTVTVTECLTDVTQMDNLKPREQCRQPQPQGALSAATRSNADSHREHLDSHEEHCRQPKRAPRQPQVAPAESLSGC